MTQEANKNEKSKVPFLEDALDNLDKPQVSSPGLDENLTGDDLPTFDVKKSSDVDFDDKAILLDSLSIDDESTSDLVVTSEDDGFPSLDTDDLNLPIEGEGVSFNVSADELDLPADSSKNNGTNLPVEDEDVLDLGVDELGLPTDIDENTSANLPVEDEDVLDLGVDELGLPTDIDENTSANLPVEDEDVLDLGVDELGLPTDIDENTSANLPVEDEDVLDLGVDELGLPADTDESTSENLPVEDEDVLDLGVDELGLPTDIDENTSANLPVEDEDVLDLGVDELGLPADTDESTSENLPVEDEDVLDLGVDELGLPADTDESTSANLPVEDEDVLDLGVDELGLPADTDESTSANLPVEDEDVLDLGVDELGLPADTDESTSENLPVEDEDVLDLGVDELGLPADTDESTSENLPVEDEDVLDLGVDELGLPLDLGESTSSDLPPEDEGELDDEDSSLDLDFPASSEAGEIDDSETQVDDFDLVMGTPSSDDNEDFDVPLADDDSGVSKDSDELDDEDLNGGLDLLMGGDDEVQGASEDSDKTTPEDDFDLMMNSDDESDEELDPISNWEKEDLEEDDIGDDEDLLNGFLPGDDDDDDDGFLNQPESYEDEEHENVDAGVADMLDSFAPAMSKDEDVDGFLSEIESKGGVSSLPEEEDFLPNVEQEENIEPENSSPKPSLENPSENAGFDSEEKEEHKESDETNKPGLFRKLSRVFVAVAVAGGVLFSSLYVSENGLPEEVSALIPAISVGSESSNSENSVMKGIQDLRKEIELLSVEVEKVKTASESNLKEYKRLVELQTELGKSHAAQMDIINSIKSSAKKYEGEMITRLEKLALYVKSVEAGSNQQQSIMRESLYKELVAYIKSNASNDDAGKLTELAENLRKQSVKTAQLDAALQAQRRVVSIIEDEQDYLRGTVESIRESSSSPSVNLLKSDNESLVLKNSTDNKVKADNSDEVCCVFVEEKKVNESNYSKAKTDDATLGYRLVSVIKRGPRSWDVFLEPTKGKGRMSVEKYTLTPTGSSSVPGYGRIKDVVELRGGDARIPYKVITENGTLVSRKKG